MNREEHVIHLGAGAAALLMAATATMRHPSFVGLCASLVIGAGIYALEGGTSRRSWGFWLLLGATTLTAGELGLRCVHLGLCETFSRVTTRAVFGALIAWWITQGALRFAATGLRRHH